MQYKALAGTIYQVLPSFDLALNALLSIDAITATQAIDAQELHTLDQNLYSMVPVEFWLDDESGMSIGIYPVRN